MGVDGTRVVTVHFLIDRLQQRNEGMQKWLFNVSPCSNVMVQARAGRLWLSWLGNNGSEDMVTRGSLGGSSQNEITRDPVGFNLGLLVHSAARALPSSLLL